MIRRTNVRGFATKDATQRHHATSNSAFEETHMRGIMTLNLTPSKAQKMRRPLDPDDFAVRADDLGRIEARESRSRTKIDHP